jgi:hypothetical protein
MVVIIWLRIDMMKPAIEARMTVATGRIAWAMTLAM